MNHDHDHPHDAPSTQGAFPPPTANAAKTEGTVAGLPWALHHAEAAVRLAQGRKILTEKFPYFSADVWTLQPVFVQGLGTFGVTARRTLVVDPAVLTGPKAWTASQVAAVLVHELYHLFGDHSRRADRIPNVNRKVWNTACFPAGTLLPSGVAIETVADMVTHHDGEVVKIDAQGGPLTATPEHPVYVRRRRHKVGLTPVVLNDPEWTPISEVRVGDYVCVPKLARYDQRTDTEVDLRGFIQSGHDSLGRDTFGNRAVKGFPLTPDAAWFIGLYTAEGSASPAVRFSLGAHEGALADEVTRIAGDLGWSASRTVQGSSMAVTLGAVVLGRWLKSAVGAGARTKHIPDVILRHADPAIRQAFVRGLTDGDGCVQTRDGRRWATVGVASEALARDLVLLLAQDDIGASWAVQKLGPRRIGSTYTEAPTVLYRVTWCLDGVAETTRVFKGRTLPCRNARWRADEHGVWYPVRSVTREAFTGPVYNLVNTPDHTYVASGFLVHNCDCEINDDLAELRNGLDLPGDYMLPSKFGLPPHQLAEVYYDALMTQGKGQESGCPQCGGAAGNPGDGPDGQDRGAAVGEALDRIFGRTDAQLQADRLATAEAMADCAGKQAGTVPDGALRRAMDLRRPPQVRWQDKLAKTMRRGIADRPGSKVPSYRRVSKITSGLGWGPGKAVLPAARDIQARVWFAIDTSGSMSPEELGIGLVECMGIIRTQGVKATFLACDADVHVVKDVNVGTDLTKLLKGGGGTDFRPVFDRYLATPVRDRPCLLVFFTDGYGCAPETPPDVPVVWLLTPNGVMPAKWGEEIKIKLPTATGARAA